MPLGSFGNALSANPSPQELSDAFARLLKGVDYLLNGGLDTLNVNELSADVINAGVLNALLVVVKAALTGATITIDGNGFKAVYATGTTITIDQNGLSITNGTKTPFTADANGLVTMIAALIQSATGYPRIELNSAANLFAAYSSATDSVKLLPIYSSGPPAIVFELAAAVVAALQVSVGSFAITTSGTTNLGLQSAKDIVLSCNGVLKMDGFTAFTGTFDVVASVNFVAQTVTYTRVTVKKGVITNVAAV